MSRASRDKADPIAVELECLQCHRRRSWKLTASQFKQLSHSWKINEDCGGCGTVTDWSFAEAQVEDEEQVDFWDWLATTGEYFVPPGAMPQHERRKEPRIDLQVSLRIVTSAGEEQVSSENISRSGLSFLSSRTYQTGEPIKITLQAGGASTPQTKTGTIVRASAVDGGKTLYGVRLMGLE